MSDFNIQFEEQDQSIRLEFEQAGGGAVKSVNGKTGVVVLDADDVGAYTKPSGGIPKTDLASAVQTSLGKADSAYQKPSSGIPASDMASGAIPTVDNTLTTAGAAADAKKTGDEIATVKDGLQDIETALDHKAEIDGYYQDMTVGNAEQLLSSVGIDESVPYNFRTSGGSADIGDRLTDKVVGGTVAWNQLVQNGNFESKSGWTSARGTQAVSNNELTYTVTELGGGGLQNRTARAISFLKGHKVFVALEYYAAKAFKVVVGLGGDTSREFILSNGVTTSAWNSLSTICQNDAANVTELRIGSPSTYGSMAVGDTYKFRNVMLIDLTQMFGSAIADYIYSLEQSTAGAGVAWFKKLFPKDYYEYNAGELMSVQTSSHDTVGFNAWDEEWELGTYNGTTGEKVTTATNIRSKNFIAVIPNTSYYFKAPYAGYLFEYDADENFLGYTTRINSVFTTKENTHFVRFYMLASYGTTYNNDICFNLSWDGERDGEYEPYVKHTYPLDSDLVLRGIPKLDASNSLYYDGDTYESDGTVTRRYGIVDLGTLTWSMTTGGTSNKRFYSNTLQNSVKPTPNNSSVSSGICSVYKMDSANRGYSGQAGVCITIDVNSTISVYDEGYESASALKTAMSGVYLVYELATPTTETADPYQNPQIVDDFGTEEYVDAGSRDVAIPVGHETFYAANLKAKLEMSPDSPSDGDGDYIVRQTNGINEYVKMVKELPTMPTSNGSYHLKVTVTSGTPTLTWEADT